MKTYVMLGKSEDVKRMLGLGIDKLYVGEREIENLSKS
jgi:hypothetical protein